MRALLTFLLLILSSFSWANPACLPALSRESFEEILQQTRFRYFPELEDISLSTKTFRSDAYFLQAKPVIKTLLSSREKRRYVVELNERLLDCPPSAIALEAILAHELEHVLDYTGWSTGKIAKHGLMYGFSCRGRITYERATDRKVLVKHLHEGLAQYREWVYQWLTPKDLRVKRRMYLTPEEIRGDLH